MQLAERNQMIGGRPYWASVPVSTPATEAGTPPNFGKGNAVGKLPGLVADVFKWFITQNFTNKMVSEATIGELSDMASEAIIENGTKGYLFEVSVLSNPSGGLKSLHPMPIPLAAGDSIDDALANHLISGPYLKAAPPKGWLYSNENSFFIWTVPDGAGGLDGSIYIRPASAYKRVSRIVFAGLKRDLDSLEGLSERSEIYSELVDKVAKKVRKRRLLASLDSLKSAQKKASELFRKAHQNRWEAARARREAARFQKMAQILSAAGAIGQATMDLAADGDKQAEVVEKNATTLHDIRLEVLQKIEIDLNVIIKDIDSGVPVPNPWQL